MGELARGMHVVQLRRDCSPEKHTLQPGRSRGRAGRRIEAVEDSGDKGYEMRLEKLDVFEEPGWISSRKSDPLADRYCAKIHRSLIFGERSCL